MRALKYLAFFLAIFAFMVYFGHKETLDPTETLAISEFEAMTAQESSQPVAVASETPGAPATTKPVTVTVPPSSSVPAQPVTVPTVINGEILEDSVNVRSGPGLDYPVVTQLYRWDKVILGQQNNGWFELYIDGHRYYVSAEFAVLTPVQ